MEARKNGHFCALALFLSRYPDVNHRNAKYTLSKLCLDLNLRAVFKESKMRLLCKSIDAMLFVLVRTDERIE